LTHFDPIQLKVVARAALLVALPFFMSFMLFFAERYILLFTFAFTGAFCFIVGVEFLAHTGYLAGLKSILDGNKYHPVIYTITRNVIVLIVMIGVLFLISFGWQYMFNSGMKFGVNFKEEEKKPKKEKKKDKKADGPGDPGKIDHSQPTVEAQDK
jgi:hypothetical protein